MNQARTFFLDTMDRLDRLETEFFELHEWFGRYDQLIWKLRSLLFTIYVAIIVYSLGATSLRGTLFVALTLFALFFLTLELFWLYKYWAKRTKRYKIIQDVMNSDDKEQIARTSLFDMDMRYAKNKRASIANKIDEPLFFYLGLVAIAAVIMFLGR
jgi:hypothetical protein